MSKDASTRRPRFQSQLEIKVTQSRRSSLGKEGEKEACDVSAILLKYALPVYR